MGVIIVGLTFAVTNKSSNKNNTSAAKSTTSSKVEKATDNTTNKDESNSWSFKGSTYKAGNLKFDFGKSEIVDGYDGKKLIAIHAKMTNISDKEMDSSAMYSVVSAYQKTDTQNKKLEVGTVKDNDKIRTECENLDQKLLPGKTVDVAIVFSLENDNDVTVHFENAEFKELGTKTYSVK